MATAQTAQQRLPGATQVGRYFVCAVGTHGAGGYDVLDTNGYAITWRETGAGAYARAEELTVLDAEREQRALCGALHEQQQSSFQQSDAWRNWMNGGEW